MWTSGLFPFFFTHKANSIAAARISEAGIKRHLIFTTERTKLMEVDFIQILHILFLKKMKK